MSKVVHILGVATLVLGFIVACQHTESISSPTQEAAIYGAVIRQLVTVDDTFGGTLNPSLIYILRETNDQAGDPGSNSGEPRSLTPELQTAITDLLADLSAEIIWVNSRAEVPINDQTGLIDRNGVLITLGNLHWQDDGSVQVPGSIYIASLAAGGQTYVLEKVDGVWTVIGNTGVQWIS